MATFKIITRKRIKTNGRLTIYLRITNQGTNTFVATGFDTLPSDWDHKKSTSKDKRLANHLEQLLLNARLDFSQGQSIQMIKSKLSGVKDIEFDPMFTLMHADEKERSNRNAEAWKTAMDSYRRYCGVFSLHLSDFTPERLQGYMDRLIREGKKRNTVSVYVRTLRAVYRKLTERLDVVPEVDPFIKGSVPRPQETAKRNLTIENIRSIYNVEILDKDLRMHRDVWILMFCMGGMDLLDIAHLQKLRGKYIFFRRMKNSGRGKEHKILAVPQALDIIERYQGENSLIDPVRYEGVQKHRDTVKRLNYAMKEIEKVCNIPVRVTSKVARHTFATVARNMGYDMELIGVLMGHEVKSVTNIYTMYSQQMIDDALLDITTSVLAPH